jgi:hypothetical protein
MFIFAVVTLVMVAFVPETVSHVRLCLGEDMLTTARIVRTSTSASKSRKATERLWGATPLCDQI